MLETSVNVDCPYCGEPFDTVIDCSAGNQTYVEDCPVCCRAMEISTEIDYEGQLQAVHIKREDD